MSIQQCAAVQVRANLSKQVDIHLLMPDGTYRMVVADGDVLKAKLRNTTYAQMFARSGIPFSEEEIRTIAMKHSYKRIIFRWNTRTGLPA